MCCTYVFSSDVIVPDQWCNMQRGVRPRMTLFRWSPPITIPEKPARFPCEFSEFSATTPHCVVSGGASHVLFASELDARSDLDRANECGKRSCLETPSRKFCLTLRILFYCRRECFRRRPRRIVPMELREIGFVRCYFRETAHRLCLTRWSETCFIMPGSITVVGCVFFLRTDGLWKFRLSGNCVMHRVWRNVRFVIFFL